MKFLPLIFAALDYTHHFWLLSLSMITHTPHNNNIQDRLMTSFCAFNTSFDHKIVKTNYHLLLLFWKTIQNLLTFAVNHWDEMKLNVPKKLEETEIYFSKTEYSDKRLFQFCVNTSVFFHQSKEYQRQQQLNKDNPVINILSML